MPFSKCVRLVLLVLLLLFRFYDLGVRPPHHDESVNGWFVDGLLDRGYYPYDPANYHGPLFFYILAIFTKIFGRSLIVLRTPIVLFSWAVTLTPFLFRKWIGSTAAWIAVFFFAVSPAMIFYSRYTIHEMEFALTSILFFYFWLRTRTESFTRPNLIGLGVTLGCLACLKENFVIYIGALCLAEVMVVFYERWFPQLQTEKRLPYFKDSKKTILGGLSVVGIAAVMVVAIYSALGRDANGISNFFKAFVLWSETGSKGNGHQKPYYYWLNLLSSLEWFAFLGLLLTPLALFRMPSAIRLMSVLSAGLFLAYSIVAYKTPWCVLSFYWGLVFLAAYWVAKWMKNHQRLMVVVLTLGFSISFYQGYECAYVNVDADNHLYIYGQTYRDLMPPIQLILDRVKQDPKLKTSLKIQVISSFTWPFPYVLGELKQVGYYGEQNAPTTLDADYVIMDKTFEQKMAPRLVGSYTREEVRARQWASSVVFFTKH